MSCLKTFYPQGESWTSTFSRLSQYAFVQVSQPLVSYSDGHLGAAEQIWTYILCEAGGDFTSGSDGEDSTCNGDPGSISGSGRFPWRREQQPTPGFLPGEFHGQKSLVGYNPWGHKESDTTNTFTLQETQRQLDWLYLQLCSPGCCYLMIALSL